MSRGELGKPIEVNSHRNFFAEAMSDEPRKMQEAKEVAAKSILEAERYQAGIEAPKGMNLSNFELLRLLDSDDDLFSCHLSCRRFSQRENRKRAIRRS